MVCLLALYVWRKTSRRVKSVRKSRRASEGKDTHTHQTQSIWRECGPRSRLSPHSLIVVSQRYVPPDQVKGPTYTKGSASTPVQGAGPEGKASRSLLGDPVPSFSAATSSSGQVPLSAALPPCAGLC